MEPKPYKHPVAMLENATVECFDGKETVIIANDFSRKSIPCGAVINCHAASNTGLAAELNAARISFALAGDVKTPHDLRGSSV